jgi:hypothetical protein
MLVNKYNVWYSSLAEASDYHNLHIPTRVTSNYFSSRIKLRIRVNLTIFYKIISLLCYVYIFTSGDNFVSNSCPGRWRISQITTQDTQRGEAVVVEAKRRKMMATTRDSPDNSNESRNSSTGNGRK